MRRAVPAGVLLTLVLLALTGCGAGDDPVPVAVRAGPQSAKLNWTEPWPAKQPALVFKVASFTVTPSGWSAQISVQNTSDIGWAVGGPRYEAELAFGVMLFPNDDQEEFQDRVRNNDLPAIREATSYVPALPAVIKAGQSWSGVISAPGALAAGLWVRIAFGPLRSVGEAPDGAVPVVQWFTDHAHRLDQVAVAAQPA
jgi:hypothetical protein